MHRSVINPSVIDRVTQRRGGLAVFDRLVGPRTAHVVVDLQNGFMAPGAIAEIPAARDIVPTVNTISRAVRAAGGLVVYIQNTLDAEAIEGWSTYFTYFCNADRRSRMIEAFTPGSAGHALWPALDVQPQDLTVHKRRFGAFVPGASDLHDILQSRGVDTLIVTGTASQVCCESTARDAMMLNYKVFFVADANATFTDEEHEATLSALGYTFCDVRDSHAVLGLLEQATQSVVTVPAVVKVPALA
ncbi:MAG TPA: isochorismatase family cysteine hydrolase [Rhodopila sp.]|nr:isochorismatase family cysteine hydrolase [Rhodopila sp.]